MWAAGISLGCQEGEEGEEEEEAEAAEKGGGGGVNESGVLTFSRPSWSMRCSWMRSVSHRRSNNGLVREERHGEQEEHGAKLRRSGGAERSLADGESRVGAALRDAWKVPYETRPSWRGGDRDVHCFGLHGPVQ